MDIIKERESGRMTRQEIIEDYGNADTMCAILCYRCKANDWYCPSDCKSLVWVRNNYDKAVDRLAKLDGDEVELMRRARIWK